MKKAYLETIALVERLHRECLEVIKADLDRQGIRDLNNVQAMILFNIGDDVLSVGELTNRGYYLGSNVSYNVKKMVENGYLVQERSPHDRRAVHVKLSPKAQAVCQKMHEMYDRHVRGMTEVRHPGRPRHRQRHPAAPRALLGHLDELRHALIGRTRIFWARVHHLERSSLDGTDAMGVDRQLIVNAVGFRHRRDHVCAQRPVLVI